MYFSYLIGFICGVVVSKSRIDMKTFYMFLLRIVDTSKWILLISAIIGLSYGFFLADKDIKAFDNKAPIPCKTTPVGIDEAPSDPDINLYKVKDFT